LFYISTAYAAPVIDGVMQETLPSADAPFRNRYEWSKQEAERLVSVYREQYELPVMIFRPSIIIGHSHTGRAVRFTGYYDVTRAIYLLTRSLETNLGKTFDRNLRLRIGAGTKVQLNVVPIDFVVEAMWRLAQSKVDNAWIFNITNDHPPRLDFLFGQACAPLSVSGIELVDPASFAQRPPTGLERIFNRKTQFQAPYLLEGPVFDNSHFRSVVSESSLPCPTADETLMGRINNYYYGVLNQQFGMRQAREARVTVQPTTTSAASDAPLQANC
jgi:nucleoside-diphosphate-sugar epimerase